MIQSDRRYKILVMQPSAIFFVKTKSGLYWKKNDLGYTSSVFEARIFSKMEILDKLNNNGLIEKDIYIIKHEELIEG